MITSDFKDSDGFKLQFEEAVSEDERKYYMKTFPRVDDVSKERIHCTTCDLHVGTAPISEKIIRTHQILNVTQCNKCFAFYNSGEFGKGEDGSEYYCRWCGQGGEVFCCSSCPFVFCNKCIRDNLTQSYIKEIESNDDWSCFVCNKDILKNLRAQHWALRNFMNKQLEKIQNVNINSEEELNTMLNDDSSHCCPRKKRKQILKPSPAPIKRPSMNGGSILSGQPPLKKQIIAPTKPLKIPVNATYHVTKPGPKPTPPGMIRKPDNNSVVCTPDIMGMYGDKSKASTSTAPPPLLIRNQSRIPPKPSSSVTQTGNPNPIYHTVNGYQIDLNHAARQEIFRLPNGKLIQVRKQSNTPAPPRPMGMTMSAPRTQFTIRPSHPGSMTTTRMIRPSVVPMLHPVRSLNGPQIRRPVPQQRPPQPAAAATSTVFTQQNGSISVARAPQPDTPFGKAKTAFEDKIISGLEICQHTINKMITLTNSSSFKTSRSFGDLKELYIHLQYLFTYTSGKIKTLQDNLVTGMEELAKQDATLKAKDKNEDGELEIVEQKQDVVEVLSDDDDDVPPPPVVKSKPGPASVKAAAAKAQKEKETADALENLNLQRELMSNLMETMNNSISQYIPIPTPEDILADYAKNDKKIGKRTVVKVERLEDSKSSVIKQYMIAIQQRREQSKSRESSPVDDSFPFMPEVVMEMVEGENAQNEDAEESKENDENSSDAKKSTDIVEIPSDDESDKTVNKENDDEKKEEDEAETVDEKKDDDAEAEEGEEKETEINENKDNEQNDDDEEDKQSNKSNEVNGESSDVSSQLPADLMEVDENPEASVIDLNDTSSFDALNGEQADITKDADISMIDDSELTNISENNIDDDEKDLLDNLISSLEESEPLASIELENFP